MYNKNHVARKVKITNNLRRRELFLVSSLALEGNQCVAVAVDY